MLLCSREKDVINYVFLLPLKQEYNYKHETIKYSCAVY